MSDAPENLAQAAELLAEVPAAAVADAVEGAATTVEAEGKTVLQEVEAIPAELSAHARAALQEVETFWTNYFVNAAGRVETTVHNFITSEVEALKARISALL